MTANGSPHRAIAGAAIVLAVAIALSTSTVAAAPVVSTTSGDTTVDPGGQTTVSATINDTQNVTVKQYPSSWVAKNLNAAPAADSVANQSDRVEWMYTSNQSSVEVSLDLDVPSDAEPGEYTLYIVGEDGAGETVNESVNVTVQQPATFNVSSLEAPSSALTGEPVTVNATVTNTGDLNDSTTIEYVFNGSVVQTQNVSLNAGDSTQVSFTASTAGVDPGNYTHGIRGDNFSTAQIEIREFVDVVGVDASGFTTINTFVNVDSSDGRNGNLTKANFTVQENGVEQTIDSVTFTQNESQTNLDIVYVFDRTGSMSNEIDDLRSQIKNVSNNLNESGRDVRFALVTYNSRIRADQNLTRNVTKLENALDDVSTGGGTELAYDAIDEGLDQRFRADSQKVVIAITDEEVNRASDSPNISQMTTRINQRGVNFVAISPPRSQLASQDPELDLRELANRTGGVWYEIGSADFTVIIDDITDRLSNTYIVTYETPNQQGSNIRTVNVTVDDPSGAIDSDQGAYLPPQADITDVNTSGFPTINATVNVNTTDAKNGNLVAANFSLSEDETNRSIQDLRFDSQTETYVVEYETADPNENGTVRDIELTVNLSGGSSALATQSYQAPGTPSNELPTVNFTVTPTNPDVGETVTLNASESVDPDGTIDLYEWDLDGDGNFDDATGVEVTTNYSSSGNRQVSLRVNDSDGGTNTTSTVVSVGDTQTVDSGGQPGFGVGIAVIAMLAIALFASRRE